MTTNGSIALFLAALTITVSADRAVGDTFGIGSSAFDIEVVTIGNPGNAADTTGYGATSHNYRIGTYEVTNNQYAAFLNAVATIDTLGLYNTDMASEARGGIARSTLSGGFTYAVKPNMGNKPVNNVSWYDAARFANWMHNGKPTGAEGIGTTETGAYTLLGGTPTPLNGLSVVRNSGAKWFLPSENEWYKAAYHKNDGVTGNYFDYPTSSDTVPTIATANGVGDVSNPGINVVNYYLGADWNGQDGNVTGVGTAGANSASAYGTFDQGGNVFEWNETLIDSFRSILGGSWYNIPSTLASSFRTRNRPTIEENGLGFRVASIPEPSTLLLLCVGSLAVLRRRRVSF